MNEKLPSVKILGVSVTTAPKAKIADFIITGLKRRGKKFYIVTPNPEMLVYASSSNSFKRVLNGATVSLPDGIGVLVAGNISKKGIKERITGVDMMVEIVRRCSKEALSIGLLGGSVGVAEKTAKCLREKYPNLRVNFVGEEWDSAATGPAAPHPHSSSSPRTSFGLRVDNGGPPVASPASKSYNPHIDILFVAFGFPKQEEWIAKNLDKIPVTCAMGVGGSFDFISGKVRRAPKFVRSVGMEWLFRLALQPWRIKRQMALPKFVYLALKERFYK